MGVGPTGKWALFLDVPEHYTWSVVNVVGQEAVRKGTGMHFQLNCAAWFYPTMPGKNRNVFPWWQESLQRSWSAVPVVELFG